MTSINLHNLDTTWKTEGFIVRDLARLTGKQENGFWITLINMDSPLILMVLAMCVVDTVIMMLLR